VKKLKDRNDTTEGEMQEGIDAVAKYIERQQEELELLLGEWKQEWSLYQSLLKLLLLDIEEAKIRHSAARTELERTQKLAANGVITTAERRKAETELAVSEIAVQRAELQMVPYTAIDKEIAELNPKNFDVRGLLKDPREEPSRPASRR